MGWIIVSIFVDEILYTHTHTHTHTKGTICDPFLSVKCMASITATIVNKKEINIIVILLSVDFLLPSFLCQ